MKINKINSDSPSDSHPSNGPAIAGDRATSRSLSPSPELKKLERRPECAVPFVETDVVRSAELKRFSYKRSASFPDPAGGSSIRAKPEKPTERENPRQLLNSERKLQRTGTRLEVDTLSPSMVARLNSEPINKKIAANIAAMKRGISETQGGFRRLTLALPVQPGDSSRPAKKLMAKNPAAAVYAVTLAESLTKNGRNYGRDFVFKALLRTDKDDPIPVDLYNRLLADRSHDPRTVDEAVNELKLKIVNEFQVGAALMQASRVMQVFEIVQIGNEFGILCEKIDGENVRTLVPKAARALEDGIISGPEHLHLARQAIVDVLIGIARCAEEGVAHSDISHNNVMYDKNKRLFKLIDMGSGREIGQQKPLGTQGYIDMRTSVGGEQSDIYAAGQLLAHFVRNRAAAPALTGFSVHQLTLDQFPFMEDLADISPDDKLGILKVIQRMTHVEPTARPSAAEMLRDPFFEACASRQQVHQCYEKLDQWEQSRQIATRFTQCYPQIENDQERDSLYGMVLDLKEAWQDEQQDRQADIKTLLNRLHSRSIQQTLKIAEDCQSETGDEQRTREFLP